MTAPTWMVLWTTARDWGLTPWELQHHPHRDLMVALTLTRRVSA